LKEVFEIEQTITTAFQDFDLVVQAFHKGAVFSGDEVVRDRLPQSLQGFDEIVKTFHATGNHMLDPLPQLGLSSAFGNGFIKNGGQFF